jgi:hypothetical protein
VGLNLRPGGDLSHHKLLHCRLLGNVACYGGGANHGVDVIRVREL